MTTDHINFPANRLDIVRHLVTGTTLNWCAEIVTTGLHEVILHRPYAILSTGEQALFDALKDAARGWSFDHDRLMREVDADTYAVVLGADRMRVSVA